MYNNINNCSTWNQYLIKTIIKKLNNFVKILSKASVGQEALKVLTNCKYDCSHFTELKILTQEEQNYA